MNFLHIKNSVPKQTDFWGNGAVYHCFAEEPDEDGRQYSADLAELEADRAAALGLKVVRSFYSWYAYEPETGNWNWENDRMQGLYKWLKRMKDRSISVLLNVGWCTYHDVFATSWNGKSPFAVAGNWPKSCENYGDWVSENVHQLIELRGFDNIKAFVLFTEPQRLSGCEQEQIYRYWLDCVKAAHDALVRDGRRNKIMLMGPNEGGTPVSDMVGWASKNGVEKYIDIFSSHEYQQFQNIPQKYVQSGLTAACGYVAGSRIFQDLQLPVGSYCAKMTLLQEKTQDISSGKIYFGLFAKEYNNIITNEGHPSPAAMPGSVCTLDQRELTACYKTVDFCFTVPQQTNGKFGVFFDVKNPGVLMVESLHLINLKTGQEQLENPCFGADVLDPYRGWENVWCSGTTDSYYDFYRWARNGLRYVPKGKKYCFDEYNVLFSRDNSRKEHGAEIITAAVALMNAGVNCSLLWTAFDQQWPNNHTYNADAFVNGDHRCGLMPLLTRTKVPHLSYYAFGLLSRFTGGLGSTVFEGFGKNNLHTVMNVQNNGTVTVVVVNCKETAEEFEISFEKELQQSFYRYSFDPKLVQPTQEAEVLAPDDKMIFVQKVLQDKIAPYAVTVYTTAEKQ